MGEEGAGSRNSSRREAASGSRYSINTLFPDLSTNNNGSSDFHTGKTRNSERDRMNESEVRHPTTSNEYSSDSGYEVEEEKLDLRDNKGLERKEISDSVVHPAAESGEDSTQCPCPSLSGKPDGQTQTGPGKRKCSSAGGLIKATIQPKQMRPSSPLGPTISQGEMFEIFQPWVLQTYGDSAKTKTITKKKYNRIVKTLRGEEINNAENSKFRFWVKAKGFHVGPPSGQHCVQDDGKKFPRWSLDEPELYVPTTCKDSTGTEKIYKRVAVVECFFDIIYTVHVETEAKNGKHAGQKRTYRAITDKYAFIPREAVTRFLLQCRECQKRGTPGAESTNNSGRGGRGSKSFVVDGSPSSLGKDAADGVDIGNSEPTSSEFDINFSLPFTTCYSGRHEEQMRNAEGFQGDEDVDESVKIDENSSAVKMSQTTGRKKLVPSKVKVKARGSANRDKINDSVSTEEEQDLRVKGKGTSGRSKSTEGKESGKGEGEWPGYQQPLGVKKEATNNNIYSNGKQEFGEQSSPLSLNARLQVNHETIHDETSSNGNKDEEEDDDDESDDKMDTFQHDPERLKAFNMFVRLFVDENLDRMIPISKQPKEKIQAIIDSCTRQFPEFAERARKRIRTYLKSCRRNKRSRDGGWEAARPTPAHLTSVQAEQILAQACENESQNAKRMRMGLEPVSQPLPTPLSESRGSNENGHHHHTSSAYGDSSNSSLKTTKGSSSHSNSANNLAATIAAVASNTAVNSLSPSSSISANVSNDQNINLSLNGTTSNGETLLSQHPSSGTTKGMEKTPLVDYSRSLNGNGAANMSMYRPNFSQTFQRPSPFPSLFPAVSTSSIIGALGNPTFPSSVSPLANGDVGPTDLSMKSKTLATQKLNSTELATVRQLITGYRESAAFLLRSADELEQLLIQQQ